MGRSWAARVRGCCPCHPGGWPGFEGGLAVNAAAKHVRVPAWRGRVSGPAWDAVRYRRRDRPPAPPGRAPADPLTGPVTITERAVLGDYLRRPVAWCELGACVSRFDDPAAFGEADVRARAIAAGWRDDAVGRLVCPACQQHNPHVWARYPPARRPTPGARGVRPGRPWRTKLAAAWQTVTARSGGGHTRRRGSQPRWTGSIAALAEAASGWYTWPWEPFTQPQRPPSGTATAASRSRHTPAHRAGRLPRPQSP